MFLDIVILMNTTNVEYLLINDKLLMIDDILNHNSKLIVKCIVYTHRQVVKKYGFAVALSETTLEIGIG